MLTALEYARKVRELTDEYIASQEDVVPEGELKEPAEPGSTPAPTANGWANLVALYAKDTRPLSVRIASLAQWILESGYGTSDLAKNHRNYAGIKYREELKDVAVPVSYKAHDGKDESAEFPSDAYFISGYWKFIARAPYVGWEKHTATPLAYLEFIKAAGYATDPKYVGKVSALFPQAEKLLTGNKPEPAPIDKPANPPVVQPPVRNPVISLPNGKVVLLDPGHGGKDPGAVGPTKVAEEDVALAVCLKAKEFLKVLGYKVFLTREKDETLDLSFRTAYANKVGADAFISVHCNAAAKQEASGTEAIYRTGHKASFSLASCVLKQVVNALGSKSRGVKASPSAAIPRNLAVVRNHATRPATLIELEFISNPEKESLLKSSDGQEQAAAAIAAGVDDYFHGLSQPSTLKLAANALVAVSPA